jgi:hypothetical protein
MFTTNNAIILREDSVNVHIDNLLLSQGTIYDWLLTMI